MPTNRQLRTRKPRSAMTPLELEGMLQGTWWFDNVTETRMRELWTDHRIELEAFWSQNPDQWNAAGNKPTFGLPEPGGMFSRCWSWWKFEAPEPRRRIGGEGVGYLEKGLSFGIPIGFDENYDFDAGEGPQYESEQDYLIRLNLLTAEEKREIHKNANFTAAGGSGIH